MGLDTIATADQGHPTGNGEDVTERVIADLSQRKESGTRKYGQPLRAFNGRNALIDAYQESLDLTVYLRQRIIEDGKSAPPHDPRIRTTSVIAVRLIQKMGGDHMVAAAARVSISAENALQCLDSDKVRESAGLINYLMKHRHGTPFEHAAMTFFVHAPIFVWREWHRHRIGFSYNETSGRYSKLEPVFWVPSISRKLVPSDKHTSARPDFVAGTEQQHHMVCDNLTASYCQAYLAYESMLTEGIAKEVARACLPVAIYSSCWVTCNPRSLMAFLSLRTHEPEAKFVSYPQAEIEEAARVAEQMFKDGWPITHAAFVANGRVAP